MLPQGKHNLTVYINAYNRGSETPKITGEATVYFGVGDITPPNITLCELDGKVFNQTTIPLNFNLNESAPWIAYSLDNDIQIAITANTTLTTTYGDHTPVVYANDTVGNIGQSETAHFTVRSENSKSRLVSVEVVIVAFLVALALMAALVAIYQKKHSRKLPQKELIPLLF